jgi:hypothetical protein
LEIEAGLTWRCRTSSAAPGDLGVGEVVGHGVVAVDGGVPFGITGEEARERIRQLFHRMRWLLPIVRPFGLAARMSADHHAEYNIEVNEVSAALGPVLEGLACPVRYVLATGASLGAEGEEMERMRASLDTVLARNPNLTVSAKVASNHSKILRNDYRAIADAIRELPDQIEISPSTRLRECRARARFALLRSRTR